MKDDQALADEHGFDDFSEGWSVQHSYDLSPAVYEAFLSAFDDRSPIHVDADYARAAGFSDCVMHGAILNGFLSHFVGMVFPGRRALLLSADIRYLAPSYLGDKINLIATVAQKVSSQRVAVLNVRFDKGAALLATGRVQVKFRA